jgi:regulator of protease activity HflC (stomatin/prohibitin superfamily)
MSPTLLFLLIVGLIGFALLKRRAVKTVERSQRLVIERFGRFSRCGGPGRHVVYPFIESGRLMDLDQAVRGWQGMAEDEIQQRLLTQLYG